MVATRMLAVNELGIRVGEDHQRAKLTNAEVDRILWLHEEEEWGYRRLAATFNVSKRTIRDICSYRRRLQHAVDFRRAPALTIEERRQLYPDIMGPSHEDCAGCHAPFPYRDMNLLRGYRWCTACYTIALAYAKNARTIKKRKNTPQIDLFQAQNEKPHK